MFACVSVVRLLLVPGATLLAVRGLGALGLMPDDPVCTLSILVQVRHLCDLSKSHLILSEVVIERLLVQDATLLVVWGVSTLGLMRNDPVCALSIIIKVVALCLLMQLIAGTGVPGPKCKPLQHVLDVLISWTSGELLPWGGIAMLSRMHMHSDTSKMGS